MVSDRTIRVPPNAVVDQLYAANDAITCMSINVTQPQELAQFIVHIPNTWLQHIINL
jgi:hypothetical protein